MGLNSSIAVGQNSGVTLGQPTPSPDSSVNGVTSSGEAIANGIGWSNSFYQNVNITSGTNINVNGNTRITGDFKASAGKKLIFKNNVRVQLNSPGRITVGESIDIGESFFAFPSKWIINRQQTEVTNHLFDVKGSWYGTTSPINALSDIGATENDPNIVITIPSQQWDNGPKNADGSVGTLTGLTFTIGDKAYGYTRIALPNDTLLGSITDRDGVTQFSPAVVRVENGSFVSPTDMTRNNFAFYGKATLANSQKVVYLQRVPGTNTEDSSTAIYAWGWIYDNNQDKGTYKENTSSLLFAPTFAQELGIAAIARRHDRIGQLHTDGRTWSRVFGHKQSIQSHQFESDIHLIGLQIGHDIQHITNDSLVRRAGIMGTYQHAQADLFDNFYISAEPTRLVPHYAQVGKADIDFISLGAYRTSDYSWGYTDYVGQVYSIKQHLKPLNNPNQILRGMGVDASAEIGHRLYQKGNWLLQIQGQVVYHWHHNMQKNNASAHYHDDQQLRLRTGLRLEHIADKQRLWLTADILHDLIKPHSVTLGSDKIQLDLPKTWLDVGLGVDWYIRKHTQLYGAIHSEIALQHQTRKNGFRGTAGIKWHF